MFKKQIPVFYLLVAAVLGSIISLVGIRYFIAGGSSNGKNSNDIQQSAATEQYTISRLAGYKYIQPMYLAEPQNESPAFAGLKSGITDFIDAAQKTGDLEQASVYLKKLNTNEWMDVHPESTFEPGSLFKVVTLTTFLRMAETNLSILDKEVAYVNTTEKPPVQTFNSKNVEPGKKYKIRELLYYMTVYSDNHATMLLHKYMDVAVFTKIFSDLGLKRPDVHDIRYRLSVKEYSRFISVLYDGGYLTIQASEFALAMLCESDFNLGITKELPKTLSVAHKFGEAGRPDARELHESAIIFLNEKPYLLTIMTKGRESVKLAEIISHISKMVYDHMIAQPA